MAKRRTNAEIAEVQAVHDVTNDIARGIMDRVDPDGETAIYVKAASYWHTRADYQRGVADTFVVSFDTKDAAVAERVALAIKAAL